MFLSLFAVSGIRITCPIAPAVPRAPSPAPDAVPEAPARPGPSSGPPIRHFIAIRGSLRAVTTCRKRRRCRTDPVGEPRPQAGDRLGLLPAALLLARLSAGGDLRLLAHLARAEGARRADGAAPCGRSVLLLHARRDTRRAAGLCAVLHRGRDRHSFGLHRFLGRGVRVVETAAPVGRGDELPRRTGGGDAGDGVDRLARQVELHPRGRLRRGRRADGDASGAARQLHQRRALRPRHRRALGDGLPERSCRAAAPSQPALSGGAGRSCHAGHHDGSVLVHPRALSPGIARGGVHFRHGVRALHQRIFPRAGSTTG